MSETPRIFVVAQVFPPARGGSGRWLWELYRRLPAGSVHVAAGRADGDVAFDREQALPITRVPLAFANWGLLHATSTRQYVGAVRRLASLTREVGPTVIHCGKALPEGALAWCLSRRFRVPYWCYVHGEELTLARTSRELRWMTRRVFAGAERLIANSHHTKGLLTGDWLMPADKVVVLHPGVDTTKFVPANRDEAVRNRLGWAGRRVVLTVGALQKRKGQDMLIRALPLIREQVPDVLYAIVGEGWEREYLESLAQELGVADAVQFRGTPSDDELVECYQQCDLFALPNRQVGWNFEGFGIVLLEAQACAKVVITGASGGTAEAVDAPHSGLVIDCSTVRGPAASVSQLLLSDPGESAAMGQHARRWAASQFAWVQVSNQAREAFGWHRA